MSRDARELKIEQLRRWVQEGKMTLEEFQRELSLLSQSGTYRHFSSDPQVTAAPRIPSSHPSSQSLSRPYKAAGFPVEGYEPLPHTTSLSFDDLPLDGTPHPVHETGSNIPEVNEHHPYSSRASGIQEPSRHSSRSIFDMRYRLQKKCSSSVIASTYFARDLLLDEPCVLRIASKQTARTLGMRNHFIRQFHQTRKLFHPRMAQVFHIEYQPKKNYLYAIQERIEGTTLEQYILGQKQGQNSLLSATEGLQFLLGMLSFLQIAHEQTGLHFRLLASDIIWYPETPTEWRVLRARCDHPYQEGEGLKAITHSEEVLATAQMLFQAMSGERTIRPNVPLSQQNPTVPATLDDVFFQAFSRDPNTRFGDVASFEEAYTAALRSSPDTPPQPASYSATLTAVPYSSQTISLEPPQQTQSFLAHMSQIVSASLDQQGNSLLTIGRDRQCKWWEPTSGQLIHSLLIDDATLQTASQSRCGRLFAFCKRNSLVEVRYAGESSPLCSLQHKSSVVALAWSANDPLLYVSTSDGLIHTWQIPSGTRVCLWDEANQPAQQMHISPNGKLMASLHKQQGMKLWSTGTKQWLFDLPQTSGHLTALAFSPETPHAPTQSLLFTGHADGTAILWDYQLGIQLQQYQLGDTGLTWMEVNADGSRLLTINKRGECAIWPLDEDSIPGNPSVLENGHEGVSSAFFVPNSNSLVLCHKDAYLSLWQTN